MAKQEIGTEDVARDFLMTMPLFMNSFRKRMVELDSDIAPNQFFLMHQLKESPKTIKELAEFQMVSPPTISSIVDTMERKELVERVRSTEDRRVVHVQLTQEGDQKLFQTMMEIHARMTEVFETLTPIEKKKLSEALGILRDLQMKAESEP